MLRKRSVAALWAAGVTAAAVGAVAQIAPRALTLGHSVTGTLSAPTPGDCYAVSVASGQPITLKLKSTAFSPKISIGRGSTCAGASYQYVKSGQDEAAVVFKPAPGRYMVLIQASDGRSGLYALSSEGGEAIQVADNGGATRREIMERQVDRRRIEVMQEQERQRLAEIERQQRAAEAEAERQRIDAENEAARLQQEADEADDEPAQPRVNPLEAFTNTFNSEMQKNAQERARQQAFLDNIAAQQREAQRARDERAELARQQAAERAQQARNLAAANEAQRQAAAAALARQQQQQQLEQNRRLEQQRLAQQQLAQQRQAPQVQSSSASSQPRPSGGATSVRSAGTASTRPEAMSCVTRPSIQKGSLCPNNTLNISVVNGCPEAVTISLCLRRNDGKWDCGQGTKNPQDSFSYPVCDATDESFVGAAYRDGGGRVPRPE